MQNHTTDEVNKISCLKSLGLAYQEGYLVTKQWSFLDHKRTNTLVSPNGLPRNQTVIFLGSQTDQQIGLQHHKRNQPFGS